MLPHFLPLLLSIMHSYTRTTLSFHGFKVTSGMKFPSPVFYSSDHHLSKQACENTKCMYPVNTQNNVGKLLPRSSTGLWVWGYFNLAQGSWKKKKYFHTNVYRWRSWILLSVVLLFLKEQRALVAEVTSVSVLWTVASTQCSPWYVGRPIHKYGCFSNISNFRI